MRKPTKGKVYLIKDTNTGLVKIGRTTDVSKRLSSLQIGHPSHLQLLHTIDCSDYKQEEAFLHSILRYFRTRGEWFRLSDDIIEWICSIPTDPSITTRKDYEQQ